MSELPDYRKPPVVEVAAGLQFGAIQGLTGPRVGSYWSLIREDFPQVQEQPPISHIVELPAGKIPEQMPEVRVSMVPPLPRTWFVSADGTAIIQVQQDRFHYNWRKLRPEQEYPRYPTVKQAFFKHWDGFWRFLTAEGLAAPEIDQCELVYVNVVPKGEGWETVSDLSELFTVFKWRARGDFLPEPEGMSGALHFGWPDGKGRLHAELVPVRIEADNREAAQFRLISRGRPDSTDAKSIDAWFDKAREWIVRGFAALTDSKGDELWERIS
ncbi:MAG: hypothetical protein AMS16_05040 [Planctomycetes bacterium DG_58]|nr:MAG: hypothetical protein AMS16_05040 [Planctomycetes bacterium DG_58]